MPRSVVGLPALMDITPGIASVSIALIDGPVASDHPDLVTASVRALPGLSATACEKPDSIACRHGTLVAGVLHAKRGSIAPGICPGCTLLVRPVFSESAPVAQAGGLPSAPLEEVANAILEAIEVGAKIINLSVSLEEPNSRAERATEQALDRAAWRGAVVVAAAGNQGLLGSSVITRHPWVIPVVACDRRGQVMDLSNLGNSVGRRGVAAPGQQVMSLAATGGYASFTGTSAAVPFVTGTIALLWSAFPNATATSLRLAVTGNPLRRRSVTPPMLDAFTAYQALAKTMKAIQGDRTHTER
jgi:subtilisin family serine protease